MEPQDWHDPFDSRELPGIVYFLLAIAMFAVAGFVMHYLEEIIRLLKIFFLVLFGITVFIGLVWCIIEIRKIKKVQEQTAQLERERQAALKAAYRRATHAHWALGPITPESFERLHEIVMEGGYNDPRIAITVDRVRQLVADVQFCLQEWPYDEKLNKLNLRAAVLANCVSAYVGAVSAFNNRDLANAWRLVNRLPEPDKDDPDKITFLQFIYLWGMISREYYTAMMPEFTTGQISPYLLDALGIEIPGQLLYELQSAYHSGRPPSQQLLAQVEHLRERVLKANQTLPKWGDWFPLLGPQTLAILDRGTEGFIHYLLAVALERPFKE